MGPLWGVARISRGETTHPDGCVGGGRLRGVYLHDGGLPAERPLGFLLTLASLAAQETEGDLGDLLDAFVHVEADVFLRP